MDNPDDTSDPVALEHTASGAPGVGEDPAQEDPLLEDPAQRGPAPQAPASATFAELGVQPEIVKALTEAGIEHTFAIQELTLPLALAGEDVIGQARTGMGKTLGFGVPLLHRLNIPGDGTPQALIVVPTRELCLQVTHDLTEAGKYLGVRVEAIYGGRPYDSQIAALQKGVDLVVGTPGRLLDLAEQQKLVLGKVQALVLDEADEMLDLGFLPDIERILRMVPEKRHTMLFSATMPGPIITLARTFLTRPTHIRAEENDQGAIHERTEQFIYRAHSLDKVELLARVLQAEDRGLTMIFTRTKRTAQRISDDLTERGFAAASVHGDLGQGAREQALRAFRTGKVDVLVATDVAARGIDVDDVTHVINYQCPEDEKTYVHRIGRTGRAGKTGVAVTLVDWDEEPRWKLISDALGLDQREPVETYSTSEHLFSDLGIAKDATGRLPLAKRTRAGIGAEVEENLDMNKRSRSGPQRSRSRRRTGGSDGGGKGGGRAESARSDSAQPESAQSESAQSDSTRSESTRSADGEHAPRKRRRTRRRAGQPVGETGAQSNGSASESTQSVDARPARRRRRRRTGQSSGAEGKATAQANGTETSTSAE